MNAIWDLWARLEGSRCGKLLVDMPPAAHDDRLRYISDALTPSEAVAILKENEATAAEREAELRDTGYPAYTTSAGWQLPDGTVRELCRQALADRAERLQGEGGADLADDERRCRVIRDEIGWERLLVMDANQRWDVGQAIEWMTALAKFAALIEEPTSPDDILGHAAVAGALEPLRIGRHGRAVPEPRHLQAAAAASAIAFCQIDSARGGVNEVLNIILAARKFRVPVCPHAGGLACASTCSTTHCFDYIRVSPTMERKVTEFVDHLHEHCAPCPCGAAGTWCPRAGMSIEISARRWTSSSTTGAYWRRESRRRHALGAECMLVSSNGGTTARGAGVQGGNRKHGWGRKGRRERLLSRTSSKQARRCQAQRCLSALRFRPATASASLRSPPPARSACRQRRHGTPRAPTTRRQ